MAKKIKKKVKKVVFKDPLIEEIVETTIEFICPVRGKVKQKVKVKKIKPVKVDSKQAISTEPLDEIDDGLSIYEGSDSSEEGE